MPAQLERVYVMSADAGRRVEEVAAAAARAAVIIMLRRRTAVAAFIAFDPAHGRYYGRDQYGDERYREDDEIYDEHTFAEARIQKR